MKITQKPKTTKKKKLNLLILCQNQFGYHIDTYFYCKYLRNQHNITYLCWNYSMPEQSMDGVKIVSVSRNGNILIRNYRYILAAMRYMTHNCIDVCFIKYFRGCSLLRLFFPWKIFIFDIRSGYINQNFFLGWLYNSFLKFESIFFNHITVISKALAKKLNLHKKFSIIPLGSIPMSDKNKNFNTISLLYVGTLSNRQIHKTIQGIYFFLQKESKGHVPLIYTIIGDSDGNELEELEHLTNKLKLQNHVKLLGRIPYEQLRPHFDTHNIGVSFVPITPYFDVQPVTKSFDYLLSGMPVIATATSQNKLIINKTNGVLINDTIEDFAKGVEKIYNSSALFNSQAIREASQIYHWRLIVGELEKYLLQVYDASSEKQK